MKKLISILSLLLASSSLAAPPAIETQFAEVKNVIAVNPGYENGKQAWSASGGTFAITATAANVGEGQFSASWTASAGSQTLTGAQNTLPSGLYGRACLGKVLYKGGDAGLKLQVIDGSSNVLAEQVLAAATTFKEESVTFICPSSGTVAPRIISSASAAIIYLDGWFIGSNYKVGTVAQAEYYGSITYPTTASCAWTTNSTSYGSYSADADCPVATATGKVSAPATKIPAVLLTNAPPGVYEFRAYGDFNKGTTSALNNYMRFSDGTNSSNDNVFSANATQMSTPVLLGRLEYTTAGTRTIELQAKVDSGGSNAIIVSTSSLTIDVYRFPTQLETVFRPEKDAWKIDAAIHGATNPNTGSGAASTYSEITAGDWTLENYTGTGNLTASILCASGNAPGTTTCPSSNESLGIAFTLPKAGDVLACVSSFARSTCAGGCTLNTYFQVVETNLNDQTILQEGKSKVGIGTTTSSDVFAPMRVCGTFTFSTPGQKALRLMYEQSVSGSVNGTNLYTDRNTGNGQRDVHWEVYPITQNMPMPVLVGSVSNPSSGQVQLVSATLANSGGTSNCTITRQDGSWISGVTEGTEGECVLSFTAGTFGSGVTPSCVANPITSGNAPMLNIMAQSSSSVTTRCNNPDSPFSACNYPHNIICVGLK